MIINVYTMFIIIYFIAFITILNLYTYLMDWLNELSVNIKNQRMHCILSFFLVLVLPATLLWSFLMTFFGLAKDWQLWSLLLFDLKSCLILAVLRDTSCYVDYWWWHSDKLVFISTVFLLLVGWVIVTLFFCLFFSSFYSFLISSSRFCYYSSSYLCCYYFLAIFDFISAIMSLICAIIWSLDWFSATSLIFSTEMNLFSVLMFSLNWFFYIVYSLFCLVFIIA